MLTKSRASTSSFGTLPSLIRSSSGGTNTSPTTLKRCSSGGGPKKSLSFSEELCKIQMVESLADTPGIAKNEIWYDGRELGGMRKQEIRKVKHAQVMAGAGNSIETDDMTWRGFEDIQGHWCRVEKSANYTTAVVRHYHTQVAQGYSDADELKRVAKGLSKVERNRARNLALKDMADAGIKMDKKSRLRKSSSSVATTAHHSAIMEPKRHSTGFRRAVSGSGLAQLRKSVSSGHKMMKMASKKLSIGNGLTSHKSNSSSSNSDSTNSNFQWNKKKTPTAAPNRTPIMTA